MTGGLYRSAHAARDGARPPADGASETPAEPSRPGSPGPERVGTDPPGTDPPGTDGAEPDRTAGNSAIMAVGSLVSRIIGFVRNAMLGMTLGALAGQVGDAYTTAQMLPQQIYELLLGGVLSSVLVPMLVRRRKADPDGGDEYTRSLLTFAVVSLAVATGLAVLAAPWITALYLGGDGDTEYGELVTVLSYLILPTIFFMGLSALLGAVLNVRGHFAAPMWAPILNNLVMITAFGTYLVVFGVDLGMSPGQMTPGRIALIGGGTLLGLVVQVIGLLPAIRKVGFRWRWRWAPRSLGLRELGGLAGWMLLYVVTGQVAVFVVVLLLNGVDEDGAKAGLVIYNNVFLLVMMAHGIIGVSVMTALMPRMSAAAADGRYADIAADLSRGIRTVVTALAPVAVAFGVLALPISVALFQGGAYSSQSSAATADVLRVGAFILVPLSLSYLCNYCFYALQANKEVAIISLPVVAIRIGGQLVLVGLLGDSLTAAGLTAGNGISYLASAIISLVVLRRRIGRLGSAAVAIAVGKVLVAAAAAAGVGLLVLNLVFDGGAPGKAEAVLQVAVGGVAIMGTYLGVAALLRVAEVGQLIGLVRRKIGR